MQNLCGASTGFRRERCITSDLWKHLCGSVCRTSACGTTAELLLAGPLQNLCGTSTEPLRHLYGTYAEPLGRLYGFLPETLHNLGSVEALQNLCGSVCRTSACATSAEPLPAGPLYITSAEPLQNLCGTSTEPLRHLYGTYAEPLRTSTDPRRLCGSVYRTSACGTSAEPTSAEPFQSLCCTAECARNL